MKISGLISALLSISIVSSGCQVDSSALSTSLTRTPGPSPTPVYVAVVKSPDSVDRAKVQCWNPVAMAVTCETRFPNGNVLMGAPGNLSPEAWSPDNRYVTVDVGGGDHDSPSEGFQVWDMVNGTTGFFHHPHTFHMWSPVDKHTLVYQIVGYIDTIPSEFIEVDVTSGDETILQECPDRLPKKLSCDASPGIVVSGKVNGLALHAQAVIRTIPMEEVGMVRGRQTVERDGGAWKQLLRRKFGKIFKITIDCYGYISQPESYLLYLTDNQVQILENDQLETIQPDSIDFTLRKR